MKCISSPALDDAVAGVEDDEILTQDIFRFNLTGNRNKIGVDDPRLRDRVAAVEAAARNAGSTQELALLGVTAIT